MTLLNICMGFWDLIQVIDPVNHWLKLLGINELSYLEKILFSLFSNTNDNFFVSCHIFPEGSEVPI